MTRDDTAALLFSAASDELFRSRGRLDSSVQEEMTGFINSGLNKLFPNDYSEAVEPHQAIGAERKLRFVVRELCGRANTGDPFHGPFITKSIWEEVKRYVCPLYPFC